MHDTGYGANFFVFGGASQRHNGEATTQADTDARTCLDRWVKEKKVETQGVIDQWVEGHDSQKLATRAQETEDCAELALEIARASIDDAERMILEAIAAWRDAEAVTDKLVISQNRP